MALRLWRRLSYLWRHRLMDAELAEELEFHRDMKRAELERAGTPPDKASAAIGRALGNVALAREDARGVWRWRWFDALCRDVHCALRSLRRQPAFAVVAIATLAAGIGATTALFSLLHATVVNPFPSIDAERLVNLRLIDPSGSRPIFLTAQQFVELRRSDVLEDAVITDIWSMTLTGQDLPEALTTQYFSANAFVVMGMRPLHGRVFNEADGPPGRGSERVVVLTYRFWQRQFGGDVLAIGRTLRLNGEPYTVIGVLGPEDYRVGPDIIVPLDLPFDAEHAWSIGQARLKLGIETTVAAARLQPLFEQFAREAPARFPSEFRVDVRNMLETRRAAPFVPTLTLVGAAAGLLAMLACANVSILLLARGGARYHEFAIRTAIGASRATLARQVLTESLVLAMAAAAMGVLTAYGSIPAALRWLPANALPLVDSEVFVSKAALLFSVAMAVVCSVVFGLAPALLFSGLPFRCPSALTAAHRAAGPPHRRTHAMLIGLQVALTVLLLAGTGSALRVLADLYQTRLGYDPLHVLAATIDLADGRHPEWQGRAAFYDRVRANIEALPGIQNVTLMVYGGLPPRFGFRTRIEVPGQQTDGASPIVHRIDSQFFSTLRIPLERGRMWTSDENARAAHVAVISQTMADRLWAGYDAVGQKIRLPEFAESTSQFVVAAPGATGWFEIVGVVGDVPTGGLRAALEPVVYVPHTMMLGDSLTVLLRAEQDPATLTRSIRDAVHTADPNQPVNRIRSAEDVLAQAGWARERFVTFLLLGFGAFALMVAAVGLYSVVSYAVSRRTKEFGIRIALGARRLHIVRLSLDPTVLPIGVGLATGLMLSIVSSRVVSRWSIGTANDPLILAAVSLVLLATAAAATLVPAGRAATMAPNQSLRID